jgi:hypothetical protein
MRLSATNIAVHHHLSCDLYLHNVYYRDKGSAQDPSELAKANFERGLEWEELLFSFLDQENLLLTIPPAPVDGNVLSANIEADDRDHFFVTGVAFWPPPELKQRFLDAGTDPVNFGLAKPDLLEITRMPSGVITWKVVDAKASKAVKVSVGSVPQCSRLNEFRRPITFKFISITSVYPTSYQSPFSCQREVQRSGFHRLTDSTRSRHPRSMTSRASISVYSNHL